MCTVRWPVPPLGDCAPPRLKRLGQKLTVFGASANCSATFRSRRYNDARGDRDGCDSSARSYWTRPGSMRRSMVGQGGLTRRSDVSTLEQSPARRRYGCDRIVGTAPVTSETRAYQRQSRSPGYTPKREHRAATAIRNEERQPWPRASGPSSRTTGAGRAFMASVCACARAPDAPSCRAGAARVVVH